MSGLLLESVELRTELVNAVEVFYIKSDNELLVELHPSDVPTTVEDILNEHDHETEPIIIYSDIDGDIEPVWVNKKYTYKAKSAHTLAFINILNLNYHSSYLEDNWFEGFYIDGRFLIIDSDVYEYHEDSITWLPIDVSTLIKSDVEYE